jgi:alkylation response protein AidB-like acyl-CoA dehydrogenase
MDLGFSQEQEIMRNGARDFIKGHLKTPLAREIKRFEQDPLGYDPAMWHEMAALGWVGCAIPAEYGGVGGSFLDLALLLEETGSSCLPGAVLLHSNVGSWLFSMLATKTKKR